MNWWQCGHSGSTNAYIVGALADPISTQFPLSRVAYSCSEGEVASMACAWLFTCGAGDALVVATFVDGELGVCDTGDVFVVVFAVAP